MTYIIIILFLIKIIIKQMPPAESSLCVKQQRFDSGKYNFDERPGRMVVAWQVFRKYGKKNACHPLSNSNKQDIAKIIPYPE
jgi:hypothetical protein